MRSPTLEINVQIEHCFSILNFIANHMKDILIKIRAMSEEKQWGEIII